MNDAMPHSMHEALASAIKSSDAARVSEVLKQHPDLVQTIDEPLDGLSFDAPPIVAAVWGRNRDLIDVLLGAGADINARTKWWAGSFGVLDGVDPHLVPFLLERGAIVDVHAAAGLGMRDRLEALVSADPSLVHARGGDGQMPLHFASSVDIAEFLLSHGADIDARDIDHESTPAQYMIRDRQHVARVLVARGCTTDILMASALGESALVARHLDADPASIRTSVSEEYFPKRNPRSGGTIYTWTLGAYKTAHQVAREFGHDGVAKLLADRSPLELQLTQACEAGDDARVSEILSARPGVAASLTAAEHRRLPDAALNENVDAVRLMLRAGWPVDARGQHGATALHWAAFHGHPTLTREILKAGPALEIEDRDFQGTPLFWAVYGSVHGWRCRTGDYVGTVEALLNAGAKAPPLTDTLQASDRVRDVLQRWQ
jgi:hypothetical protein